MIGIPKTFNCQLCSDTREYIEYNSVGEEVARGRCVECAWPNHKSYNTKPIETPNRPMRMYFFVMYNLSGIQKGIQAGHCALEYAYKYGMTDPNVEVFVRDHKTFILLSGGGSNDMLDRVNELDDLGIQYATFHEPDLNGSLSAIAFLVHKEDYADEDFYKQNKIKQYLNQFQLALN